MAKTNSGYNGGSVDPERIKWARLDNGLSVSECARMVYVSERNWRRWEAGDRAMPEAAWELFKIKLKQQ